MEANLKDKYNENKRKSFLSCSYSFFVYHSVCIFTSLNNQRRY